MAEEKEVLTQEEEIKAPEKESTEEENVEDYFNPFADVDADDDKIEKEIKKEKEEEEEEEEEEGKKTEVPIGDDVRQELAQVKAERIASREVSKFIKDNPQFSDMEDDIVDLASKAMVKGHSKPVEFAIRNVKNPSYWIDYGKKIASEDIANVSQNRVGGSSLSKGDNKGVPDFSKMSKEEFNEYTRQVMNNA